MDLLKEIFENMSAGGLLGAALGVFAGTFAKDKAACRVGAVLAAVLAVIIGVAQVSSRDKEQVSPPAAEQVEATEYAAQ